MALPDEYSSALESFSKGAESDLQKAMYKLQSRLSAQGIGGDKISGRPQSDLMANFASAIAGKRGELELAGAERGYQATREDLARKFQEALLGKEQAFTEGQNLRAQTLQEKLAAAQLSESQRQFDLNRKDKPTFEQQLWLAGLGAVGGAAGTFAGTKLAGL